MQSARSHEVTDLFDSGPSGPACTPHGRRIILVSFASNVIALFIKGLVGILCGSQALVADAMHTLSDVLGFGVNYVGARTESPSSHATAFVQSGLVSAIMFLAGVWILADNTTVLIEGSSRHPGLLALVVGCASILTNCYLFGCSRRVSRESNDSSTFICMVQNRTNLLSACLAFVGMLLADLGLVIFDPICAIAVGGLLFKGAFDIWQQTSAEQSPSAASQKRLVLVPVGALASCIVGLFVYDTFYRQEVVLIPSQGLSTSSPVDNVLGRSECFVVLNTRNNTVTRVRNSSRYVSGDVSDALIGIVKVNKVNVVLAAKIGAEMFSDLRSLDTRMYYIDRPGTVEQIFSAYQNDAFELARAPNVAKGYGRSKIHWLSPW